jgi:hypothetical protein
MGACTERCPFAHSNPTRLNATDKSSADDAFNKAYAA